ncbi:hypothetical protein [Paenibacillus hemerocallicola]|uniref:hypothetical protein n=1 Tax=Paenibacillus hemerocallicola TaxID=1172614 RepID=UPI00159EC033|nr:hypothetical protein [Paenibacillus hemerocallicola]
MTNHIIPVSNGLFEHRERIGPAIWEFLWLIDRTTTEEVDDNGERWGLVLGGVPVKHEQIAHELGSSERTVKRNLARLKDEMYISSIRAPYGEIIRVAKNKKQVGERSAKYGLSPPRERTKMAYLDEEMGQKWPISAERSAKSGLSNKDITITTTTAINTSDPFENLFSAYCEIHGKLDIHVKPPDITLMTKTITKGVPVPLIVHVMKTLHKERTAKGAKISSFAYYTEAIAEAWEAQKAITDGVPFPEGVPLSPVTLGEESITTDAPTIGVALGPRTKSKKNRQQSKNELAAQKIREAEERERKRDQEDFSGN